MAHLGISTSFMATVSRGPFLYHGWQGKGGSNMDASKKAAARLSFPAHVQSIYTYT